MFKGTRLCIKGGTPPLNISANHRITKTIIKQNIPIKERRNPLVEAFKYAEVLNEPSVETLSQVGLRFGVSRARVSQMLNLLNLDERIKNYLMSIKEAEEMNYFSERKLREIAVIKNKKEQYLMFRNLIKKINEKIKI